MQGRALFDRKTRPSQMEIGVSFFFLFRYYDSCSYVPMSEEYVIQIICPYVILSLKQFPLSLKYVIKTICHYGILSKKIWYSV